MKNFTRVVYTSMIIVLLAGGGSSYIYYKSFGVNILSYVGLTELGMFFIDGLLPLFLVVGVLAYSWHFHHKLITIVNSQLTDRVKHNERNLSSVYP